jgi:hypothetical protein
MLRDLDPPMDDPTRVRLGRLIDAIETGPPPSLDELADREQGISHLQIVSDNQPGAREPRRTGMLAVVGIAAALALILGAALVLRDRGPSDDDVSNDPAVVPRLVLDPDRIPDVMATAPAFAADLPLPADQVSPGTATVAVYGDPAAEDPIDAANLAIIVVDDETIGLDGDPVTLRGHEARLGDSSQANDVGIAEQTRHFRWVSWHETEDVEITLASRTLRLEELMALADGLVVDRHAVRLGALPATLSGPLEPLGTLAGMPFDGAPYAPGTAPGHVVFYGSDGPWLSITTFDGDPRQLDVIRWMTGATQPVVVRDTEAWFAQTAVGDGVLAFTVVWQEAPGVIAVLQTDDASDDVLGLADGLRTATDDEWSDLLGHPAEADTTGG